MKTVKFNYGANRRPLNKNLIPIPTIAIGPTLLHQNTFRSVAFWAHALFIMSATLNREKLLLGNGRERNSKLFLECFDAVRKLRQYWNKWIVDDCWIDIINERFDIPTQLQFAAADLNRAIGRDKRLKTGIDKVGDPNVNGVYKAQYFPSAEGTKKTTRVTAYYVTSSMKLPQKPGGNTKWFRNIVSTIPEPVSTIPEPTPKRSVPAGRSVPTERNTSEAYKKKKLGNLF
jgi:hypothetical protein